MSAKKKIQKGPSWFEVGLGAFLSIILGVALGAVYMVSKPVAKVSDIPKDAPAGAVYYLEGAHDYGKSADVASKRKSFLEGESVSFTEGELNTLLGDMTAPSAPQAKSGDKPAPPADPKPIAPGVLNARIRGGGIQFADPVTLNAFGFSVSVIVQATGSFARHGSSFAFEPDVFYVGGCPVQRFLFLRGWIQSKLLFPYPVSDDVAAAWAKLSDVSVDGTSLRLKGPQG